MLGNDWLMQYRNINPITEHLICLAARRNKLPQVRQERRFSRVVHMVLGWLAKVWGSLKTPISLGNGEGLSADDSVGILPRRFDSRGAPCRKLQKHRFAVSVDWCWRPPCWLFAIIERAQRTAPQLSALDRVAIPVLSYRRKVFTL